MDTFRSVLLSVFFSSLAFGQSNQLYVFSTDFLNASVDSKIVALDTTASTCQAIPIMGLHKDSVVRAYNGLLYVIERFGSDKIKIYDPQNNYDLIHTIELEVGANPQDIGFISPQKAYITQYGNNDVVIFNPTTGQEIDTISLASYAIQDGIGEVAKILILNGRAYVLLQNLVGFQPIAGGSKLVVIDTNNDTVINAVNLPTQNPVSRIVFQNTSANPRLLIGLAGIYGTLDGGFVGIPYSANALGTPYIVLPSEAALGGDLSEIAQGEGPSGNVWYSMTDSKLWKHVGDNGTPLELASVAPFSFADILSDLAGHRVYLANNASGELKAFDTFSNQAVPLNCSVTMKPFSMALGTNPITSVTNAASGITSFQVFPNPVTDGRINVRVSVTERGDYRFGVFATDGKMITSTKHTFTAGSQNFTQVLPGNMIPGSYIVKLMNPASKSISQKIVVQ